MLQVMLQSELDLYFKVILGIQTRLALHGFNLSRNNGLGMKLLTWIAHKRLKSLAVICSMEIILLN